MNNKLTYTQRSLKKLPKIHCESDYRDIRIYINDILFICIPRPIVSDTAKESLWLQSYYVGSKKRRFYYIIIKHPNTSGGKDWYGFDNFEIWKKILQLLDEEI